MAKWQYIGDPSFMIFICTFKYPLLLPPVRLLMTDPDLGWQVWLGPAIPAQYRLHGPGAWAGARDVIMTVDKSIYTPVQTFDRRLLHADAV